MTPLTTILLIGHRLAVAVFVVLVALQGTAHGAQPNTLGAIAVRCAASAGVERSLRGWTAAGQDRALAALDSEVVELEDEEQEPPPELHALSQPSRERLWNFSTAKTDRDATPLACWVPQRLHAGHPRAPPIR